MRTFNLRITYHGAVDQVLAPKAALEQTLGGQL